MTLNIYEPPVQHLLPVGYVARPATLDDLQAAIDLANAYSQVLFGEDQMDYETVYGEWTQPNVDITQQSQAIFTPDGKMVAILEFWDVEEPPVKPWIWARVHPDYEGQGLGTYLLRWSDARAQLSLSKCPPDAKFALIVACPAGHTPSEALFTAEGYTAIRHFYTMRIDMETRPTDPIISDGIRIRTFRPEDTRPVFQTLIDAFRDHWGFVDPTNFEEELERWEHMMIKESQFDPNLWFLAEDIATQEIVGISLCRPQGWSEPNLGWVSELGVLRAYRKRGIALALLQSSFQAFWDRGQKNVGLGVDGSSLTGALRLYERAGMYKFRQRSAFEKVLRDGVDLTTQSVEE